MTDDYHTLFGRICAFRLGPPLVFAIPELHREVCRRLVYVNTPVELVVPDLDAFCVPEEDVERIQQAVEAALDSD